MSKQNKNNIYELTTAHWVEQRNYSHIQEQIYSTYSCSACNAPPICDPRSKTKFCHACNSVMVDK